MKQKLDTCKQSLCSVHGVDENCFPCLNYKLDMHNDFLLGMFRVDETNNSFSEVEAGVDACN